RYYYEQYDTNFISAMPTNLYGPGDNFNLETSHVLPALIRKFHLAKLLEEGDIGGVKKDVQKTPIGFGLDKKIDYNKEDTILRVLKSIGITKDYVMVEVAVGRWISFLGSGDMYLENAIFDYIHEIKGDYHLDFISSKIILTKNNLILRYIGEGWILSKFRKYMNNAHVGSLHNLKLFKEIGLFDTEFKIAGDYEFLLRKKDRLNAAFVNKVTAIMKVDGVSNKKLDVFVETFYAKFRHTDRNRFILIYETVLGVIKWYLRKLIFRY
ncbi:MAG: NAD-dependent epimerase/dehydratase family protein, partial [Minisyncoccia bacterium]